MTEAGPLVLIIDNEKQIRRFLREGFELHGFRTIETDTVATGLKAAVTHSPDLIILDLLLPDGDGAIIVERFRGWSGAAIIVLSAKDEEAEKVRLLEMGADDYVTKPFGMAELIARARAALRRSARPVSPNAVITVGRLKIDLAQRLVLHGDHRVKLSRKEFRLLSALAINQGKVLTHHQLMNEVWGEKSEENVQYLRILVRKIRNKIEDDPQRPAYVETELGVGYRLRTSEQISAYK